MSEPTAAWGARTGSTHKRISTAIEELIRYSAPVPHATFRVTTQAVDLEGVQIPAGRQVLVYPGR
jgi:cytochrome P450